MSNFRGIEYISPEGLRVDGRRPGEVRKIKCKMGVFPDADGSASFMLGNTLAVATVYGPREQTTSRQSVQSSQTIPQQEENARVSVEYSLSAFSTRERRKRIRDRTTTEISQTLTQALESVIITSLYPRSTINVFVEVMQSDGGNRSCALNASILALVDAGIPIKDVLCCVSAGYLEGTPILDLNYIEELGFGPDLPIAIIPKSNKVVLLQMESKVPAEVFKQLIDLAISGCHAIHSEMCSVMKNTVSVSLSNKFDSFSASQPLGDAI